MATLTPLLYLHHPLLDKMAITRPHTPAGPMLIAATGATQACRVITPTTADEEGIGAAVERLGYTRAGTVSATSLLREFLGIRPIGGWTGAAQILVATPTSTALVTAQTVLEPACPQAVHTHHRWWLGRACLIAASSKPRTGQDWAGAPASIAQDFILPVFRLAAPGESAHTRLADTTTIAEDLKLLAQHVARGLSYPRPFGGLTALRIATP